MTMARSNQITAGTDVYGSDDHKIGSIAEVGQNYLLVQKGFLFTKDLYLPMSAVARVDADRAYLSVTKDAAEKIATDTPPATDMRSGTMTGGANRSTTDMTDTTTTATDASMTPNRPATPVMPTAATTTTTTTSTVRTATPVAREATTDTEVTLTDAGTLTVPLVTEMLRAETVWRESGIVRLRIQPEAFAHTATAEVTREELAVEQVAVGRVLAEGETVEMRQVGDVTIVPVIREEAVLVTRRVLDHKLHITKRPVTETRTLSATLHRTRATINAGPLSDRVHMDGTGTTVNERNGTTPTATVAVGGTTSGGIR